MRPGGPRRAYVRVCAWHALKKTCMFRVGRAMRVCVRIMHVRIMRVGASVCEREEREKASRLRRGDPPVM